MPNLTNIVLDTESHYNAQYSLSKLSPIEYIRDDRFKLHGCGIKIEDSPTQWFTLDTLKGADIDWSTVRIIGHNLLFDSLIITERLGIHPAAWRDTMSLAKSILATPRHSLDFLSKLLLKDEKLKDESGQSMVKIGQKLHLSPEEDALMGEYCEKDVELTYRLHKLLSPFMTPLESRVQSTCIRWFAEPTIELNEELLASELIEIQQRKEDLIHASGWPKSDLSSNSLFVQRLQDEYNIDYPTKISPTTGKPTPATGKSDPEFISLKESRPDLDHIWSARTEIKSTLQESRVKTLINIANLGVQTTGMPTLPVPLNYFGAHTGRFSGAMSINLQNLPSKRTSKLRLCLKAPKDHVLVVSDSAQIELRVTMWLTGQLDLHDLLATNNDLYKWSASKQFGIPVEDVSKEQRQFGKVCELGLSYGMGAIKFQHTCASGPMGMVPFHISDSEATKAVNKYRASHPKVQDTWRELTTVILTMMEDGPITTWRGLKISKEAIELPDGVKLRYPNLQLDEEGNFQTGFPPKISKIYGSLMLENLSQSIARAIIAEQIIAVEDAGYRTIFMCHDEIVVSVHKDSADQCLEDMIKLMSIAPKWAKGLVLSADGGYDVMYSK